MSEISVNHVLVRLLQVSSGSNNRGRDSPGGQPRDFNQFAGFLFWYVILLLCCAVPTVCAYRRRRQRDGRLERLAHLQRMAANGVISFGNAMPDDNEETRAAKLKQIDAAIKNTTMEVASKHLLTKEESQSANDEEAQAPGLEDVDLDGSTREYAALKLDANHENGDREVAGACAICLCGYEPGDEVTFSPNVTCQHVFHTECIKAWMVKKEQPLCPCCRQEFCTLEPVAVPSEETDAA